MLLGERNLYYMLSQLDPEFPELFKVAADFEEEIERTGDGEQLYARLLGTFARREGLRPLDRDAVARAVEQASRRAADAERLQVHAETVADLLREADHLAGEAGAEVVTATHVQAALDAQVRRASRVRERIQEDIRRGTLLIDTRGEAVGQVNALVVLQLGGYAFGRPSRITARARLGNGNVVDIEKEVALGGPIHSKGVLILAGFLGQRFASERPLSLAASLVFEQSYSGVEGDSASCGELVALLSALGQVPVRQGRAITGSVNQHGQVQPIGGVNEKIEGFFDVCRASGLTGDQGVLVPASNVKHLMLRADVVEAAEKGQFHVWPVADRGRSGGAAHRRARGGEGCRRPLSGRVGQPAGGRPAGRVRGEGPQLRARRPGRRTARRRRRPRSRRNPRPRDRPRRRRRRRPPTPSRRAEVGSPGRGRLLAGFLLLTLIWGTTWAAIRIGLEGVPPFTGVALRFALAGALLDGARARLRRPPRPRSPRAGHLARERRAVLLPLVLGRLLVRAVHSLGPRRRALRDLPAVRGRARALPPPGGAAPQGRGPRHGARVRRGGRHLLRRPHPPGRGGGAPRGLRHARGAAGLGGGQRRGQAVGKRRPPAVARGRAHAARRRRDGGRGPPRRAGPAPRLRRPLGGGAPLPGDPRLGGHVHDLLLAARRT